ncbi:MAG: ABC transporter permease [Halapricum sp.]
MTLLRSLLKRISLGLVATWGVLTVLFGLFALTDNWVLEAEVGLLKWGGASEEAVREARQEYFSARGLDRPVTEQYVGWITDMFTLQWGESWVSNEPVISMVAETTTRTAMYVIPAFVIAVTAGVFVGVYVALHPESRLANTGRMASYLVFALPGFWVGGMLLSFPLGGLFGYEDLFFDHLLPIALTAATLLGGYVSYARAHSLEYATTDFVRLVEAKGAGPLRVARHVVRNAAIPLFSMLFTEILGLLVLTVFVIEVLFGIDGFGRLLFDAVDQRDLPVLLGGTMVIIAVGVGGNVLQDVAYSVFDPRVDTGSR